MSKSSTVRRPQASKRDRELAKVALVYAAGTGENMSQAVQRVISERENA